MNFETKYLIRWGIPGWMFIFWIAVYFVLTKFDYISTHIKFSEIGTLVGLFISLSAFGVVLGYIIHHLYFVINWIVSKSRVFDNAIKRVTNFPYPSGWKENNNNDYFYFEFLWHKNLLEIEEEEKRTYIVERYRYLLSTIHTLGTVLISHLLSAVFTIVATMWIYGFSSHPLRIDVMFGIQVIIILVVLSSFKYYSANLNYFQGSFLDKMLKKEL
ncbi:hypothetical protein CHCC14598_2224 [Bacillus licheniformis]|uniref:hypothetical protein n=1 Tax=Bacillus licheniformis TaxID=1402 RepID=UPI0011BE22F1|nr:hypothetical protein [Bacillus licheniformis]TWM95072.1 hypothetical protein CHCC14598_2224 [Bacillus licheniformis]